MSSIGSQIKILRKAKGITQEEMGETLGISYQAISKWENATSLPDAIMIPKIADYFGVSIDELFGYKLNALTNKERFVRHMIKNHILCMKNENGSDGVKYYINSENFHTNAEITKIGEFFADCIKENRLEFDTVFGLAYHGIVFSSATAIALFNKYGMTVNYCFDRRVPDKRGRNICGRSVEDGERIVIIDDVFNTGKTLDERISQIKKTADVEIVAVIVIVDGINKSKTHSENDLMEKYGAKFYSIITSEDIDAYLKK